MTDLNILEGKAGTQRDGESKQNISTLGGLNDVSKLDDDFIQRENPSGSTSHEGSKPDSALGGYDTT